jgi:Spy/CpxP family protein refolding chaperone
MVVSSAAVVHGQSPYAGQERREIKALSESEMEQLRTGAGMGLARAAELNGYPGPKHVLELAAQLELTPEQLQRVESIFEAMRAEAVARGVELIEAERELDRGFASGGVDPEQLRERLERIGSAGARLRLAHLGAHLETKDVLTPEQAIRYSRLRGYLTDHGHGHDHGH